MNILYRVAIKEKSFYIVIFCWSGQDRDPATWILDLFTNDVILAFDDALRWNMFRIDIEIELTKGIFFLEVVFPSTKAHFDLNLPLIGRKKSFGH